jgi:hypothetical protein
VRYHPVRTARPAAENNREKPDKPGVKLGIIFNLSP